MGDASCSSCTSRRVGLPGVQLLEELLLDVQGFKAQRAELISREEGLLHPTDRNGLQCCCGTGTTRLATRLAGRALDPVQLISERTHRLLNVEELLRCAQVRGVGKVRAGHRDAATRRQAWRGARDSRPSRHGARGRNRRDNVEVAAPRHKEVSQSVVSTYSTQRHRWPSADRHTPTHDQAHFTNYQSRN